MESGKVPPPLSGKRTQLSEPLSNSAKILPSLFFFKEARDTPFTQLFKILFFYNVLSYCWWYLSIILVFKSERENVEFFVSLKKFQFLFRRSDQAKSERTVSSPVNVSSCFPCDICNILSPRCSFLYSRNKSWNISVPTRLSSISSLSVSCYRQQLFMLQPIPTIWMLRWFTAPLSKFSASVAAGRSKLRRAIRVMRFELTKTY